MKKIRNSLIALVALVATAAPATAGIEVLGIEVLGIEVLGIEVLGIEVLANNAPAGSTVEAVAVTGGQEFTVGSGTICPQTGYCMVQIPASAPISHLVVRGPQGEVLSGYNGPIELE